MAIKATLLQSEYRKALNRLNSNLNKRVPIIDGDKYINEAIDFVFENFATKFELNSTVRNHLRQLEVKREPLKITEKEGYIEAELPEGYYMSTRQFGEGSVEGCDKKRLIDLYVIQTSDITNSLKDPFWKPSFEWEEALIEEAGNNLIIYPGDIKFDKIYIDYLKKPNHIATPSKIAEGQIYKTADGRTIEKDIDFEVDSTFIWRKVVRVAALNTLLDMGDVQNYQAQLQNIMTLDKIYIN